MKLGFTQIFVLYLNGSLNSADDTNIIKNR